MLIVILDERKAALRSDKSNVNEYQGEAISNADLIITITPDGYFIPQPSPYDVEIQAIRPTSEAEMSAEKSKQQITKLTKDEEEKSEEELRGVIQERMLRSRSIPQPELKPRDFEF